MIITNGNLTLPHTPGADMHRILLIDDEPQIRAMLSRFLESRGYHVSGADSGEAGLALAASEAFSLVVCDLAMPGMDGIETIRRLRVLDADIAVLMLTGVNDARTAMEAVTLGAADYLMKPIALASLQEAVERALHQRRLQADQRRIERIIREEVAERTAELEIDRARLRAMTVSVAEALISAMEAKDVHLRGHSERVAAMAAAIAEDMRLDEHTVEQVRLAGRLHDVGSIGVRESVLNKPGPLDRAEIEHVKEHVRIGLEILRPMTHLTLAASFVEDHHEHWDGTGYARGLRGEDISIGGRIIAVCDTYDALTSTRSYQRQRPAEDALRYMRALGGTRLDPHCLATLERVVTSRIAIPFVEVTADGPDAPAGKTRLMASHLL